MRSLDADGSKELSEFVHLHVHSDYSLLDGMISIDQLLQRAIVFKMPAVAMTDLGNLHGALDFYQKAREVGVKPILGCEISVASGGSTQETPDYSGDQYHHLVLLAENNEGYANLVKIVSEAQINGSPKRQYIDHEFLAQHSKGLIALSGCLKGEVPFYMVRHEEGEAIEAARRLAGIFGPNNFFLEIQDTGLRSQKLVNPGLMRIARALGLGCVATNDCHYLNKELAKAHFVLQAYEAGRVIQDPLEISPETDLLYFRSSEEMSALFANEPELISNSLLIAERCNVELDLGKIHYPNFPFLGGRTPEALLGEQARTGLEKRLSKRSAKPQMNADYSQRLEHELEVICDNGFAPYFLTVAEYVNWAQENGIPVGPGRGAVVGSLVAYSLGITFPDPISHGLLFERFINPENPVPPDIDVDFGHSGRDQVIDHVVETYGQDKVAHVLVFGMIKAKASIHIVGQTLGLPESKIEELVELIPDQLKMTLQKALELEPRLADLIRQDPKVALVFEYASQLEGLHHHATYHSAGRVLAPGPLTNYVPVFRDQAGRVISQFDFRGVKKVGLPKFDFLGQRELSEIDSICRLIRENHDPGFDLELIPTDDKETFDLLSRGDTDGVFNLESSEMRARLKSFQPVRFRELVALLTLSLINDQTLLSDFYARMHGRQKVSYAHPLMEPILEEIYGLMIYLEQFLLTAQAIGGFSLGQAELVCRNMKKQGLGAMEEHRSEFLEGAMINKVEADTATRIYDSLLQSIDHLFCKAHNTAYGLITYQMAFLKANYPVEFAVVKREWIV